MKRYTVRVVSRHTGRVYQYRTYNPPHTDKRGVRAEARGWARKRGLTGRLKVSMLEHTIPEGGTMAQAEKDGRVRYVDYASHSSTCNVRFVEGIDASKRQLKRWNKEKRL